MEKKYKSKEEGKKHYKKLFMEFELGKNLVQIEKSQKKKEKKR
jgi:hypothetical protein